MKPTAQILEEVQHCRHPLTSRSTGLGVGLGFRVQGLGFRVLGRRTGQIAVSGH